MPDGQVRWIDSSLGEAGITDDGRSYVANLADVEPPARRVGAWVHFAIHRAGGLETAVEVSLRGGMRTSPRHRRVGTLAGAHDAEAGATEAFTRRHAEYGRSLGRHPLQVVAAWGQCVAAGQLDDALALYDADALLHLDGVSLASRVHIGRRIESLPVFASGRQPSVRGSGDDVVATWEAPSPEGQATEVRSRVRHGLIAEQWMGAPGPGVTTSTLQTPSGEVPITTTTQGDVEADAVEYALSRLRQIIDRIDEPVLSAAVKLAMAPDPARVRPALAQANLDLNGTFLGAHVAAHEMREAVDLLQKRLTDQLQHRAQRVQALRRHSPGRAASGEWQHGDLPSTRPEYFDRPAEERDLVRHKAFYPAEQTVDEAIFDMEQLDYDFYLFRNIDTGDDGLVERLPGGGFQVRHVSGTGPAAVAAAYKVDVDNRPAPALTVEVAIERLAAADGRFVFFSDSDTGRGSVVYLRYDGHYGMITIE